MRTLAVCGLTLSFVTAFCWLCCAFISGVWSPMAWEAIGRFLFVFVSLFFGVPIAIAAGATYEES